MDIRLIYFLTISIFLWSCSRNATRESTVDYNINTKEFKLVFFKSCLENGFNDADFETILSTDRSVMGDFPLGLNNYKLIDSLVNNQLDLIRNDSILWMNKHSKELHEYIPARKRVLKYCLDYYGSFELDSIAKSVIKELE